MAEAIVTTFQAYKLTEEELANARVLNHEQKMYYQTLLSSAAGERLTLEYDPKNELNFAQRSAYLHGQMDILSMILGDGESIKRPDKYKEESNPSSTKPQE